MTERYGLIDRESLQPFFSLVLFCGIALLLSIPAAERVGDFDVFGRVSGVPIYFYVHALLMGVLGLNLGATSLARGELRRIQSSRLTSKLSSRMCLLVLLSKRILLAQLFTFPYLLFAWALYPGREGAIALLLLYTTLIALLCALLSHLLEGLWPHAPARGFTLKYALFAAYIGVPFFSFPQLSPLGMVSALLHGDSAMIILLGYAVPVLLLAGMVPIALTACKETNDR